MSKQEPSPLVPCEQARTVPTCPTCPLVEAASYVIARRGLGYTTEKIPKQLTSRFGNKKEGFAKLASWKQWSAIKKAAVAAIKKQTKKEVKSLVFWQHHRKQLIGIG